MVSRAPHVPPKSQPLKESAGSASRAVAASMSESFERTALSLDVGASDVDLGLCSEAPPSILASSGPSPTLLSPQAAPSAPSPTIEAAPIERLRRRSRDPTVRRFGAGDLCRSTKPSGPHAAFVPLVGQASPGAGQPRSPRRRQMPFERYGGDHDARCLDTALSALSAGLERTVSGNAPADGRVRRVAVASAPAA